MDIFPMQLGIPYKDVKKIFHHINQAFGMRCLPDLLELGVYPDAKELTESMAAFDVVRHKLPVFDFSDPSVAVIAVADGSTPRTGAMFAFRSAWSCVSIDPNLRSENWSNRINRLICVREKVEDCWPIHAQKMVIAAVHSHAPFDIVLEKFTADERIVIAIPCCYDQSRERKPDLEYADPGIWSPKNIVRVWHDKPTPPSTDP